MLCRKGNKYVKQLGKLSPLIALILLIGLLATLVFHGTKVSRLGRELLAAQTNVQSVRGELLQSQVLAMMQFSPIPLGLDGGQESVGHAGFLEIPDDQKWLISLACTASCRFQLIHE